MLGSVQIAWSQSSPNACSAVVGLTGGIASGKSTVSNLLRERSVPVIDADVLAREVVAPGTSGLRAIVSQFGAGVLLPDGTLDRKKLGGIIFRDATKRKVLNGIVHPAVRRAMLRDVVRCWWGGESVCVLDVPLLVEAGLWRWVGDIVVVYWWVSPFICPTSRGA
jgi:dephospho-CoA kinase